MWNPFSLGLKAFTARSRDAAVSPHSNRAQLVIQAVPHFWSDHESCPPSPAAASFVLPACAGSPRRQRRKAGKGCDCSGSAANAGISQALVLYMSGTLAKLDGSPSAARAVTLTVLRLAPLALTVEPVR